MRYLLRPYATCTTTELYVGSVHDASANRQFYVVTKKTGMTLIGGPRTLLRNKLLLSDKRQVKKMPSVARYIAGPLS